MDTENIVRQLKDTMVKVISASHMLNDGKVVIAKNKMLGIYQKLGYIINLIESEKTEKVDPNENDKDQQV